VNQFGAGEIAVRLNKATEWKLSAADPLQLKTKLQAEESGDSAVQHRRIDSNSSSKTYKPSQVLSLLNDARALCRGGSNSLSFRASGKMT